MPGKVVLFFPSYYSDEAAPPLALIHLAAPLVARGYDVRIVDSAITADSVGTVLREAEGALCVGVSMVTGPMITQGVEVARAVRARLPEVPLVAGGWHASILPEQTLRAPYFDAVVKGQGEITFSEVVDRFAAGERDLGGIAGCHFKRDGQVVWNADRGYTDINALPARPFHLVDFEAYARKCAGLRWILYCTSHGCPWDCSYCSNASVYGRNWKPLLPESAVAEMAELTRRYRLQVVDIIDDNYLVRRDRALEIAERLIARGPGDRVLHPDPHRPDGPAVRRGARHAGPQRAAPRVLRAGVGLGEGHALGQQAPGPGDRLPHGGALPPRGHPALLQPHLRAAGRGRGGPARHMAVVDRIGRANPEADFFTNIFSPYPGSPIWPLAVARGREGAAEPRGMGGLLPEDPGAALAGRAAATPASSASATTSASAIRRARWWWSARAA